MKARRIADLVGAAAALGAAFVFLAHVNWRAPQPIPTQQAEVLRHEFTSGQYSAQNAMRVQLVDGREVLVPFTGGISRYAPGDRVCVQGATRWLGDKPDLWITAPERCGLAPGGG